MRKVGRPKKWKNWKLISVMIPHEYEEIYKMAAELARVEGVSLSEMIARALKEYVNVHQPGGLEACLQSPEGAKKSGGMTRKRRHTPWVEKLKVWIKVLVD